MPSYWRCIRSTKKWWKSMPERITRCFETSNSSRTKRRWDLVWTSDYVGVGIEQVMGGGNHNTWSGYISNSYISCSRQWNTTQVLLYRTCLKLYCKTRRTEIGSDEDFYWMRRLRLITNFAKSITISTFHYAEVSIATITSIEDAQTVS